jgi:hypothetical protein
MFVIIRDTGPRKIQSKNEVVFADAVLAAGSPVTASSGKNTILLQKSFLSC